MHTELSVIVILNSVNYFVILYFANYTAMHEVFSQLFYIVFFRKFSLQTLKAAFTYSWDMSHFKLKRHVISNSLRGLLQCFSVGKYLKS